MKSSKKHSTAVACLCVLWRSNRFFFFKIVDTVSACDSNSLEIQNKGRNLATKVCVSHLIDCCCYEDLLQSAFKWFEISFFPSLSLSLSHKIVPFATVEMWVCFWCSLNILSIINIDLHNILIQMSQRREKADETREAQRREFHWIIA